MTKQKTSIVLVAVMFLMTAGPSGAGILTIGNYTGEPGMTVTATIDLSSLGGAEFTSMDIAVEVLPSVGTGSSPALGYASASTEDGWAWSPFSAVNDDLQTSNSTDTLWIYGVSGTGEAGTTSTLEGTVLKVPIIIPLDAAQDDVFLLDLREADSNISNNGTVLPAMPGWVDGSITIIPEPATVLMIVLSLLGLGVIRRRF